MNNFFALFVERYFCHRLFLCFLFALLCFDLNAQTYFQQQTDYQIEVSLNDTTHELNGFLTLEYKNNSPDKLHYVYFHLWANAFRGHNSEYAKQALENGNTDFHFSKPAQRGGMDGLDFKADGETCKWFCTDKNFEICKVVLNRPLLSGEVLTLSTPFRVKLPHTFSRLGHEGQSYQISQWYPKPAVYDASGWHTMPYLDQGEFYSEFGSYDVKITLPQNYRVAATGDLQNEEELKWLDSLSTITKKIQQFAEEMKFPASSANKKTLHYKQSNVHDFAWFADKRYHVLKGEVELPQSKRKVTTWAMFTNNKAKLWMKAGDYIADAVMHYSELVGEYPYAQVSAVEGALEAGGGMEYPNVTVIGDVSSDFSLDLVITHEVGHNWFYGILGSNERDHAWMDEGINSYYEYRYTATKYPQRRMVGKLPRFIGKIFDLNQYKHKYLMDVGYQLAARENYDQPCELQAPKYTDYNYGVMVYGKTMLALYHLENYLGTVLFDSIMKKYFDVWKFKHPQPANVRQVFDTMSGKNLSWFFDDMIGTTKKLDYAVTKGKPNGTGTHLFTLVNKGTIAAPLIVTLLDKDTVVNRFVLDGFTGKRELETTTLGTDRLQIDPQLVMPEINRKNNTFFFRKALPRLEKIRFQFLGSLENQNRTQVFFAPYFGVNNYDKVQVGAAFYNSFLPTQKFNYLFVPALGTGSLKFIGMSKMAYNFFPDTRVQQFTVGISGRRFSYLLTPANLMFHKLEPFVHIVLKKKNPRSPYEQSIHLRSVNIWLEKLATDKKVETQDYYVNELKYTITRKAALNPFEINLSAQQGNQFLGLFAEGKFLVSYKKKNQGLKIRVFSGGFPYYAKPPSDIAAPLPRVYLSTVSNPTFAYWLQKDYLFDENFIDRNGTNPNLARQVALTGGAFRSLTTFGGTSSSITAINLSTTIHRFVPIQPFVNGAVVTNQSESAEFAAELGASLVLIPGMAEIHLPLVTSNNIKQNQEVLGINKWYQRFTFTLKWQIQKPLDMLRRFI